MHPSNNPPPNALIVTNDLDHRYHALCAEWRIFPGARETIASDIRWHPEWGVAIRGEDLVQVEPGKALDLPKPTFERTSNYTTRVRGRGVGGEKLLSPELATEDSVPRHSTLRSRNHAD
jgi:hypothetical protein